MPEYPLAVLRVSTDLSPDELCCPHCGARLGCINDVSLREADPAAKTVECVLCRGLCVTEYVER